MRPRSVGLLVAALLLVSGAVTIAACGGGGSSSLTLDQYFKQMESISRDSKKSTDDVSAQFDKDMTAAGTEDKQLKVFEDYLNAVATAFGTALDKIKALDPPTDASSAHKEFVSAGDALLAAFKDFSSRAGAVKSEQELQDLVGELDKPPLKDAGDRVDTACNTLQSIADKNSIKVDLTCSGEVTPGSASPSATGAPADLQTYFTRIQGIFKSTDSALNDISSQLDSALASATGDTEQVSAFRDSFSRSHQTVSDAVSRLESIDPPPAARDAHNAFLQAARHSADLSQQILDQLGTLNTTDEVNAYFNQVDADLTSATNDRDKACADLQTLASANNISVDLNCGN